MLERIGRTIDHAIIQPLAIAPVDAAEKILQGNNPLADIMKTVRTGIMSVLSLPFGLGIDGLKMTARIGSATAMSLAQGIPIPFPNVTEAIIDRKRERSHVIHETQSRLSRLRRGITS